MEPIILNIRGQVPSGKNAQGLAFRGGRVQKYPRDIFKNWRESFAFQARFQTKVRLLETPLKASIVYRQKDFIRRDIPGQLDALWHGLAYAKILKDDYWIRVLGGVSETLDRVNPGVIITIESTAGM